MLGLDLLCWTRLLGGGIAAVAWYTDGSVAALVILVAMLAFETESLHDRLKKIEEDEENADDE